MNSHTAVHAYFAGCVFAMCIMNCLILEIIYREYTQPCIQYPHKKVYIRKIELKHDQAANFETQLQPDASANHDN